MNNTYKKIVNNTPIGDFIIESNIKDLHQNVTNFDDDTIAALGYCKHFNNKAPINDRLSKTYVLDSSILIGSEWQNNWVLVDKEFESDNEKQEAVAEDIRIAYDNLRNNRNYLLRLTDFYGFSDSPTMPDNISQYRQELRDMPETVDDPFNISWPVNPEDPDGTLR